MNFENVENSAKRKATASDLPPRRLGRPPGKKLRTSSSPPPPVHVHRREAGESLLETTWGGGIPCARQVEVMERAATPEEDQLVNSHEGAKKYYDEVAKNLPDKNLERFRSILKEYLEYMKNKTTCHTDALVVPNVITSMGNEVFVDKYADLMDGFMKNFIPKEYRFRPVNTTSTSTRAHHHHHVPMPIIMTSNVNDITPAAVAAVPVALPPSSSGSEVMSGGNSSEVTVLPPSASNGGIEPWISWIPTTETEADTIPSSGSPITANTNDTEGDMYDPATANRILLNMKNRCCEEPHVYHDFVRVICRFDAVSKQLAKNKVQNPSFRSYMVAFEEARTYRDVMQILWNDPDLLDDIGSYFDFDRIKIGLYGTNNLKNCHTSEQAPSAEGASEAVESMPTNSSKSTSTYFKSKTTSYINSPGTVKRAKEFMLQCRRSTEMRMESLNCEFNGDDDTLERQLLDLLRHLINGKKWKHALLSSLNQIFEGRSVTLKALSELLGEVEYKAGNGKEPESITNGIGEPNEGIEHEIGKKRMEKKIRDKPSYKKYSDSNPARFAKCSGRTRLCDEVLNNDYYSVSVTYPNFKLSMKSEHEEHLQCCEDARFQIDRMIDRNSSTIEMLQRIERYMEIMTPDQREQFQLTDDTSFCNNIAYKQTIQLLYDNSELVMEGLCKLPTLFIPNVLKDLKLKGKEWAEIRSLWNLELNE